MAVLNDQWRAERFGGDGECYVAIFCGPDAELRARGYGERDAEIAQLTRERDEGREAI